MLAVEDYPALIQRLETQARISPRVYKVRLTLLAMLGYAALTLVLLTPLLLGGGVVALVMFSKVATLKLLKFGLLPIVLISCSFFVLRTRFILPQGYRLQSGEAPLLVAEVELLRRATGAPALSGIIIYMHLNAAAVCIPRLMGLLGSRHYLVVGLPLMQLLDRRQFVSAVAHEFGHFGGGHHRFGAWIYLLRQIWSQFLEVMQHRRSITTLLFKRFFAWYSPYFNAWSFVLARRNEIEADVMAARIAGNVAAAQAVVKIEVGRRYLKNAFWSEIGRGHSTQPDPPQAIYRDMVAALRSPSNLAQQLADALAQTTSMEDTHPCLAERLGAWGMEAAIQPAPETTAADELLGSLQQRLEARFSHEWFDQEQDRWHKEYQKAAERRVRLDRLDALRLERPLEGIETLMYASLVDLLRNGEDVTPLYEAALRMQPENAAANYRYGELLLQRKSPAGVAHLERAIQHDMQWAERGLAVLLNYYQGVSDHANVMDIRKRLGIYSARKAALKWERKQLSRRDVFLSHDLDAATLEQLVETVNKIGRVKKIWIARKQISDGGKTPHYVVLVRWSGMTFNNTGRLHALLHAFKLPGTIHIITEGAGLMIHKLRKAAGKPVYARGLFSRTSRLT